MLRIGDKITVETMKGQSSIGVVTDVEPCTYNDSGYTVHAKFKEGYGFSLNPKCITLKED